MAKFALDMIEDPEARDELRRLLIEADSYSSLAAHRERRGLSDETCNDLLSVSHRARVIYTTYDKAHG